jgi:hypothetical protein
MSIQIRLENLIKAGKYRLSFSAFEVLLKNCLTTKDALTAITKGNIQQFGIFPCYEVYYEIDGLRFNVVFSYSNLVLVVDSITISCINIFHNSKFCLACKIKGFLTVRRKPKHIEYDGFEFELHSVKLELCEKCNTEYLDSKEIKNIENKII